MKSLFLFFLLLPKIAVCQTASSKYADTFKEEIDKNIFRVMLTLALDESLDIKACYEREICKPLSFVIKAGPSFSREYISTDAWGNEQYQWAVKAVASGELRCYYNLKRRIRHEKTIRNFSAYYLSLEPFVMSSPLIYLNNAGEGSQPATAGAYINIGFQKQVRHTYFNLFFGTRFFGKIYAHSVDVFDIIHAGVTIGRAF